MEAHWEQARKVLAGEGWNLDAFERPLNWPFTPRPLTIAKMRGTLFGVAVGDALGAPAEGRTATELAADPVRGLRPHNGRPAGAVTDDTQLTLAVATSLLERGTLDPEDLVRRFLDVGPELVAAGWATRQALERLGRGAAWWLAGSASAGNGAAMRAAPAGLFFEAPDAIRRAAFLQALVTHRDPTAVAAAIVHALWVGWLARGGPADTGVLAWLAGAVEGLEKPLASRRGRRRPLTLAQLLEEVEAFAGRPREAFAHFRTGAFVLESLPSAAVVFLSHPGDPETALLTLVNAGGDTDTMAALAGAWLGAHLGDRKLRSRTPSDWWRVSAAAEIERISRLGTS